jgi:hypothetical protein
MSEPPAEAGPQDEEDREQDVDQDPQAEHRDVDRMRPEGLGQRRLVVGPEPSAELDDPVQGVEHEEAQDELAAERGAVRRIRVGNVTQRLTWT